MNGLPASVVMRRPVGDLVVISSLPSFFRSGSSTCSSFNWFFRKNCYERKYPDLSQLCNGYFIAAAHHSSSSTDNHTYNLQLKHHIGQRRHHRSGLDSV
uniref:Uncharacterized protein n=2 Tax=Oryza glumipatula TaxID=40148 RepID=A0A0E0BHF2_9ORYZ